jgi:hypothetical protein
MQPCFHIGRKFHRFRIAEDLYGKLRLIDHHLAILASLQMVFEFLLHRRLEFAVDVARDLADDPRAVQFG